MTAGRVSLFIMCVCSFLLLLFFSSTYHLIALLRRDGQILLQQRGQFVEVFLLQRNSPVEQRHLSTVPHLLHHVVSHLRYALVGQCRQVARQHGGEHGIDHGLQYRLYVGLQRVGPAHQPHGAHGGLQRLQHGQAHEPACRYLRDGRSCPLRHHCGQYLCIAVLHIGVPCGGLLVAAAAAACLAHVGGGDKELGHSRERCHLRLEHVYVGIGSGVVGHLLCVHSLLCVLVGIHLVLQPAQLGVEPCGSLHQLLVGVVLTLLNGQFGLQCTVLLHQVGLALGHEPVLPAACGGCLPCEHGHSASQQTGGESCDTESQGSVAQVLAGNVVVAVLCLDLHGDV
nr:MAG TPA: hypothetical protein [Caudoviricetes sp.]